MSNLGPTLKQNLNLSLAWAHAFLDLLKPGISSIEPLIVDIGGLRNSPPQEDEGIRRGLDGFLAQKGLQSCHTVANTIFPRSLWSPILPRERLYERYLTILPKLKKDRKNQHGLYFERLIAFQYADAAQPINQLEHIISTYNQGNHRASALQASLFDPSQDHTHTRQLGFPCLQQISITVTNQKYLHLTGYYATQYYVERAYGNFLGLAYLGWFMAQEMKLELNQLTCVAAKAGLGNMTRSAIKPLSSFIRDYLTGQSTLSIETLSSKDEAA